jgi:hypothetical protein
MTDETLARRSVGDAEDDLRAKSLDLMIDNELKLLAAFDARQAGADARTAAISTAAVALPALIFTLANTSATT